MTTWSKYEASNDSFPDVWVKLDEAEEFGGSSWIDFVYSLDIEDASEYSAEATLKRKEHDTVVYHLSHPDYEDSRGAVHSTGYRGDIEIDPELLEGDREYLAGALVEAGLEERISPAELEKSVVKAE